MRAFRLKAGVALAVLSAAPATAQAPDPAVVRRELTAWVAANQRPIVAELVELLRIPNVARDSVNIRRNAAHLLGMLGRRGFVTALLEAPGTPPAVFGELRVPGATRTVVLYAHYDGQPVDTTRWRTSPWEPVLFDRPLAEGGQRIPLEGTAQGYPPEARINARSASDDKSPIVAFLAALDGLRAAGRQPSANIKVFLEGEEEAGSSHLADMLTRHRARLAADGWLFLDGPVHQTRQPQVVFGVRGSMGLGLTVYGPYRPLHSGHYGNWAPNPAAQLVHLLASLRSENGRTTVPGFYDGIIPPGEAERRAFATIPPVEAQLLDELQLRNPERAGATLAEEMMLPAFNITGLSVGGVGPQASNTIHTMARAAVNIRLVAGQTPAHLRDRIEAHLRSLGWTIVHAEPDEATRRGAERIVRLDWSDGYPATRIALDHPFSRAVVASATAALGTPVIEVPTLGGSLPMHHFTEILGAPLIVLPMVNHDNNQHAEDENLRLQNLWDGIVLYGGMLVRLGREWGVVP